jgi:hypothetical protein
VGDAETLTPQGTPCDRMFAYSRSRVVAGPAPAQVLSPAPCSYHPHETVPLPVARQRTVHTDASLAIYISKPDPISNHTAPTTLQRLNLRPSRLSSQSSVQTVAPHRRLAMSASTWSRTFSSHSSQMIEAPHVSRVMCSCL